MKYLPDTMKGGQQKTSISPLKKSKVQPVRSITQNVVELKQSESKKRKSALVATN
jgi:hypothetical protein